MKVEPYVAPSYWRIILADARHEGSEVTVTLRNGEKFTGDVYRLETLEPTVTLLTRSTAYWMSNKFYIDMSEIAAVTILPSTPIIGTTLL